MAVRNNKETIITRSFFIFFSAFSAQFHSSTAQLNWVKAGYWYAGSDFPISDINSGLFTHLICAFANVSSATYELSIPSNFQKSFSNFTNIVKQKNPSIITLLSIWNGQPETYKAILGKPVNNSVLSSMVKEPSKRRSFIQSSITTARLNGFQGIDLFWLWPNGTDLSDLGVLLDEWRAAIDSEPINPSNGSKLALTIGVRYSPNLEIIGYPIDSMKKNLDWAHVVAYDYHLPSTENFTGNHAGLYNPTSNISTDFGIKGWLDGGFPASKLVLGLPYHGYAWTLVYPGDTSVGAPASGPAVTLDGSIGYRFINSFIQNYGYGAKPVYNATYVVNYFIVGSTWINYDDAEAIRVKVSYAKEKGLLGYNVFQVINDDNWALSLAALQAGERQDNKKRLLLKVLLPIAAIIVLFMSVMCFCRRRVLKGKGLNSLRNKILANMGRSSIGEHEHDEHSLQVFSFAKIKAATNNFSIENKLGEGGFGPVYKGKLPKGQEIAVKRLSVSSTQGFEEFKNEVSLAAKLQHVNLVRVLGYCIATDEKMLIYEYMQNRSLDHYLFNPERGYQLDWDKCVRIIEGIIQGLLYLQEYSNFTVIHRDLKASNILLDKEMNPKISDFGMARTFNKDVYEASTSRIVGTYGYVPPEYVTKGRYSMKYDVYSFGVLLLQIISGKRNNCCYGPSENLNLLEYAYELWKDEKVAEFIDPSLDDSCSSCKLVRCTEVALLCVQENPEDRPTMLEVFSMLKNETVTIAVSKRPAFSVKKEEAWETTSTSHHEIYSFDDSESSQLEPR